MQLSGVMTTQVGAHGWAPVGSWSLQHNGFRTSEEVAEHSPSGFTGVTRTAVREHMLEPQNMRTLALEPIQSVWRVCASRDGQWLCHAGFSLVNRYIVRLISLEHGTEWRFRSYMETPQCAFSIDGNQLLIETWNAIEVRNLTNARQVLRTIPKTVSALCGLRCGPRGEVIEICERKVIVHQPQSGETFEMPHLGMAGPQYSAISGSELAVASYRSIRILSLNEKREVGRIDPGLHVIQLAATKDCWVIGVLADDYHRIDLWDRATRACLQCIQTGIHLHPFFRTTRVSTSHDSNEIVIECCMEDGITHRMQRWVPWEPFLEERESKSIEDAVAWLKESLDPSVDYTTPGSPPLAVLMLAEVVKLHTIKIWRVKRGLARL